MSGLPRLVGRIRALLAWRWWPATLMALALPAASTCGPEHPATLVLTDGRIYSGVDGASPDEAIAIDGDTVVFVGSSREARRFVGRGTRVIDLEGATAYPGWGDTDVDLAAVGRAGELGESAGVGVERDSAIVLGARAMAARGWTEVHHTVATWAEKEGVERLAASGLLPIRVYLSVAGPGPAADSLLAGKRLPRDSAGLLETRSILVDLDELLALVPTRGAAGPRPDRGEVAKLMRRALLEDIQVRVKASDPTTIRAAMDLIEEAQRGYRRREKERFFRKRWRLEGLERIDTADVFRLRVLELVPLIHPVSGVAAVLHEASSEGPPTSALVAGWRTLVELGLAVAGGSGGPAWPTEAGRIFHAATARATAQGFSGPDSTWHPEQALVPEQALRLFTRSAAWAAFRDDVRGELRPGRWADLTVFDRDLVLVSPKEALAARPVLTIVAGKVVYSTRP